MKYSQYITVGFDENGKRIRKHVYGNTKVELAQNISSTLAHYRKTTLSEDITFKEYADRWLKAFKSMREAATYNMYEYAIGKMEIIHYKKLANVKQLDCQTIINDNIEHPRTCQQILLALKQIFKNAIKNGLVTDDPTEDLSLPETPEPEQRVITKEELKAIKEANLTEMERMYVQLLFYLGLRPQEATALMPEDFDWDKHEVTIRRAVGYDKNNPYIKPTKTKNVRIVPIPHEFCPMVKSYTEAIKTQNCPYLLRGSRELMTKAERVNMWKRIKKKINVKLGGDTQTDLTNGLRPYHFRHTYCTNCYYANITLKMCQYLMGHASLQMIMKVYAHLDNSREPLEVLKNMTM